VSYLDWTVGCQVLVVALSNERIIVEQSNGLLERKVQFNEGGLLMPKSTGRRVICLLVKIRQSQFKLQNVFIVCFPSLPHSVEKLLILEEVKSLTRGTDYLVSACCGATSISCPVDSRIGRNPIAELSLNFICPGHDTQKGHEACGSSRTFLGMVRRCFSCMLRSTTPGFVIWLQISCLKLIVTGSVEEASAPLRQGA
jgi:hypothetical protein